jgi:TIR domain-containing protein
MPKVFISHAQEDLKIAERVYVDLIREGIDPWLASRSLLPGQNWGAEIRRAIKGSQYFLALLSMKSVSKRGFVQKEIKAALDVFGEFPANSVFIIPVRLDRCQPREESLGSLHWVDLFPSYKEGMAKIVAAIKESAAHNVQRVEYRSDFDELLLIRSVDASASLDQIAEWRPSLIREGGPVQEKSVQLWFEETGVSRLDSVKCYWSDGKPLLVVFVFDLNDLACQEWEEMAKRLEAELWRVGGRLMGILDRKEIRVEWGGPSGEGVVADFRVFYYVDHKMGYLILDVSEVSGTVPLSEILRCGKQIALVLNEVVKNVRPSTETGGKVQEN